VGSIFENGSLYCVCSSARIPRRQGSPINLVCGECHRPAGTTNQLTQELRRSCN
jgi:hypothetical protein